MCLPISSPNASPGSHRTTAREECVKHPIVAGGVKQHVADTGARGCWPSLALHNRRVDNIRVPSARKLLFTIFVNRGSYDGFDDVHVVADGCRRKRKGHVVNELLHRAAVHIREAFLSKVRINLVVESRLSIIDSRLFNWIPFPMCRGRHFDGYV